MRKRVDKEVVPPERELARTWTAAAGATTHTADGTPLRVRYPGRPNAGPGPDFLDAVLETPGGELRGAVELHRETGDWQRHGHAADPRYAGVVLHVVGRDDGQASRLPGGAQLPLLELRGGTVLAGSGGPQPFPCAVRGAAQGAASLLPAVHAAAEARFESMVARLAQQLAERTAGERSHKSAAIEQVAYERLAEALGYSRNAAPMRTLAAALPLRALESDLKPTEQPRTLWAEALFLGAAGLLPSQRHLSARRRQDAYVATLERTWAEANAQPVLRGYSWEMGSVRPENAPVRRVLGLAHLALRWPTGGIVPAVEAALRSLSKEGTPGAAAVNRRLAALVAVPCPAGYWQQHWDAGVRSRGADLAGGEIGALVGPSRAADMVVNVLLPLSMAVARASGRAAGTEMASQAAFRAHGPLAENWITRLMRERTGLLRDQGLDGLSARAQQGLIAVYEATCHALRCDECALNLPDALPKRSP